ncbi:hypothetical protein V2J09_023868 [Rumex salicifolius]
MTDRDGLDRDREEKGASPNDHYEKQEGTKPWGAALFGLIGFGATASYYSWKTGRLLPMLQRVNQFCGFSQQINRTQSSWKGGASRLFQNAFEEQAWRKYDEELERVMNRRHSFKWDASYSFGRGSQEELRRKRQKRMQEEYEDEMERVERIRRMQSVFNRERNKRKRTYESWTESDPGSYHQHSQREDWYWKADNSYKYKDTKSSYRETPKSNPNYSLSHHYAVLGLNRSPTKRYTEAEIKSAFRTKAMQFHPDQNHDNKEAAEAKFKEVLASYEAIKSERKT